MDETKQFWRSLSHDGGDVEGALPADTAHILEALRERARDVGQEAFRREVRSLRRDAVASVATFRIEQALATADGLAGVKAHPLARTQTPLETNDPHPSVRVWGALRGRLLGQTATLGTLGDESLAWMLENEPLPARTADGRRLRALLASEQYRALAPWRFCPTTTSEEQRCFIASERATAEAEVGDGAGVQAAIDAGRASVERLSQAAHHYAADQLRGINTDAEQLCADLSAPAAVVGRSIEALGALFARLEAAGLVIAMSDTGGSEAFSAELRLRQDLAHLYAFVDAPPVSIRGSALENPSHQAIGVALRALFDVGAEASALALAWRWAAAGACSASNSRALGRIATLLARRYDPLFARAFMVRSLYSARRRRQGWSGRIHPRTLRRLVASWADPSDSALLSRLFTGRAGELDATPAELTRWTRWLFDADETGALSAAGGHDLTALAIARRQWLPTLRRSRDQPLEGILQVGALLDAAVKYPSGTAARGGPMAAHLTLILDGLRGRHGETYLVPRLLDSRRGLLDASASLGEYPAAVDRHASLMSAVEAKDAVAEEASRGKLSPRRLKVLRERVSTCVPAAFRQALGARRDELRAGLQLHATLPGVPWEQMLLPSQGHERPLSEVAPCYRYRGAGVHAGGAGGTGALIVYDSEHAGAEREARAIADLWRAAGEEVLVACDLDTARSLLEGKPPRVVHYAGHHTPASDTTPALRLAGERWPIRDLAARCAAHPPEVLFLNACDTLSPTKAVAGDGDAQATTLFGALEPLLASTIPNIVGTLWPVRPPADDRFPLALHEALLDGANAIDATFAARLIARERPAWRRWLPSYVLYACPVSPGSTEPSDRSRV